MYNDLEERPLRLPGAVTAPLTAPLPACSFYSRVGCLGRANYRQCRSPGVRLSPRDRSTSLSSDLCYKASPQLAEGTRRFSAVPFHSLERHSRQCGHLTMHSSFPLGLSCPGLIFPTLLLEEKFKSGSVLTVRSFLFLCLLKNAIQEARPNTTATSVTMGADHRPDYCPSP